MHRCRLLASSDASFHETRPKMAIYNWKNVNWRFLACSLAWFGDFDLATLLRQKLTKKRSDKKS